MWRRLQSFAPVLAGTLMIMGVVLLNGGTVYSGHLLQGKVSITMQLFLDASEKLPAQP